MINTAASNDSSKEPGEMLLSTEDVAELIGVSSRKVLMLPIRQIRLGHRTIRFRLRDVYEYLGIDNPNC